MPARNRITALPHLAQQKTMVGPAAHAQMLQINNMGWQQRASVTPDSLGKMANVANLFGDPPDPKCKAPAPTGIGAGANCEAVTTRAIEYHPLSLSAMHYVDNLAFELAVAVQNLRMALDREDHPLTEHAERIEACALAMMQATTEQFLAAALGRGQRHG